MEVCGYQIFPELVEQARPGRQWRDFEQMMKKLKREASEEEAVRVAKQRAREEEGEFYLSDEEEYFGDPRLLAKISGSNTTGLLQLPPEVLTLIIEHCLSHRPASHRREDDRFATLKTLRLVHPQFAHLRYLKRCLFANFTLSADPGKLWAIDKSAHRIAPYVSVVFMRPVLVDKERLQAPQRYYSNSKIKDELKPVIARAIESGSILSTWIGFLGKVRPRAKVVLKYLDQEGGNEIACPGPAPQPFLQLAIASLAASRFKPTDLDIQHCSQSAMVWTNILSWTGVRFEELQTLSLSLSIKDSVKRRIDSAKLLFQFADESTAILRYILKCSKLTIQNLTIDMDASAFFQSDSITDLPALRCLTLNGPMTIKAAPFGCWISRQRKLHRLYIDDVSVEEGQTLDSWKPIFDAVKNHPFELLIEISHVVIASTRGIDGRSFLLCLRHPVPQVNDIEQKQRECGRTRTQGATNMLQKYISGSGEWDTFGF